MAKKVNKTIICTFCVERFTKAEIWWVDMIMHRADPSCKTTYSTASCEKCKGDPENAWMIVGVSGEPKPKREKKSKNPPSLDEI